VLSALDRFVTVHKPDHSVNLSSDSTHSSNVIVPLSAIINTRGRNRGGGYAAMLALQLFQQIMALPVKPPITIALIALNAAIHFIPDILAQLVPMSSSFLFTTTTAVCMNPAAIARDLSHGSLNLSRLFGSALIHGDDMHLWYNMLSLLNKGVTLETAIGSGQFVVLVLGLWALSQLLVVVLSYALLLVGYTDAFYMCSVGFSGVIFALKYILGHRSVPGLTQVMHFTVDIKYAAWAELILIQFIVPNASFLGHLCGILAGILWEHTPTLLLLLKPKLSSSFRSAAAGSSSSSSRYTYARGTAAQQQWPTAPQQHDTTATSASDEDAAVQLAMRLSLEEAAAAQRSSATTSSSRNTQAPAQPVLSDDDWIDVNDQQNSSSSSSIYTDSTADELRQRRLRRFNN
jgi:membrane associated rhomboid family serine protease